MNEYVLKMLENGVSKEDLLDQISKAYDDAQIEKEKNSIKNEKTKLVKKILEDCSEYMQTFYPQLIEEINLNNEELINETLERIDNILGTLSRLNDTDFSFENFFKMNHLL